jgi:hypothetical protein
MAIIDIPGQYGYVVAVGVTLWAQQAVFFVIPVVMARSKTGIQPPTLYPRDSEIKALNLSAPQVESYMCAQRAHQNNVEFLVLYFPMLLLAGLQNPIHAAIAGGIVAAGRLVSTVGYLCSPGMRVAGGW